MTDLTIIIPQYGQTELTVSCLHSLRQFEPARIPVVIVDDGTASEELAEFKSQLAEAGLNPRVRLLEQPHTGVTAAWNRGALEIGTKHVMFLNNDVLFEGALLDRINNHYKQNQTVMTGFRWRRETIATESMQKINPGNRFLEGWGMVCRLEDYFQLGGFDEKMSVYFSDTDFQLRFQKEFGSESLERLSDLPIKHLGHRTANRTANKREIWCRDRATFVRKWESDSV